MESELPFKLHAQRSIRSKSDGVDLYGRHKFCSQYATDSNIHALNFKLENFLGAYRNANKLAHH